MLCSLNFKLQHKFGVVGGGKFVVVFVVVCLLVCLCVESLHVYVFGLVCCL